MGKAKGAKDAAFFPPPPPTPAIVAVVGFHGKCVFVKRGYEEKVLGKRKKKLYVHVS